MDMLLPPGVDAAAHHALDGEAFDRRLDLIAPVHKALRRFMFDTLIQAGAVDTARADAVAAAADGVERLLDVLGARAPALRGTLAALRIARAGQRAGLASRLYRELAALVTEQLSRMARDEERRNPVLWLHYSDDELRALRAGQLAALSIDELAESLGWMCDALRPEELAGVLHDLHASASPETFRNALEVVSARLTEARWDALAGALGMARAGEDKALAPRPLPLAA